MDHCRFSIKLVRTDLMMIVVVIMMTQKILLILETLINKILRDHFILSKQSPNSHKLMNINNKLRIQKALQCFNAGLRNYLNLYLLLI